MYFYYCIWEEFVSVMSRPSHDNSGNPRLRSVLAVTRHEKIKMIVDFHLMKHLMLFCGQFTFCKKDSNILKRWDSKIPSDPVCRKKLSASNFVPRVDICKVSFAQNSSCPKIMNVSPPKSRNRIRFISSNGHHWSV